MMQNDIFNKNKTNHTIRQIDASIPLMFPFHAFLPDHRRPILDTVVKKSVLLLIPFTGFSSIQVRRKILAICRKFLPQVACKVVLKPSFWLAHFFLSRTGFLIAFDPVLFTSLSVVTVMWPTMGRLPVISTFGSLSTYVGVSHLTGKS